MKFTNYFPILGFFIISSIAGAQSLAEFTNGTHGRYYETSHWGFALNMAFMSNPDAPYSSAHKQSGFTLKMDYKRYGSETGEKRMFYQNKSIGDLIFILGKEISKNEGVDREEGSTLSNLIGWTSWGWNLLGKDKYSAGLGFNINDYIIGATYYDRLAGEKVNERTLEPQGYYWGSGPSLFFDYALSERFVIQSFAAYSLTFYRMVSVDGASEDKSYRKPHFLHFNMELQTSFNAYCGFDYSFLLNRGDNPNNTRRFDFFVGYRF